MQAAADVVSAVRAADLTAGVQLRHDDVDGRHARGVHRDGDAAAVVTDLDTAVLEQSHVHPGGVACHRFVQRGVDDLPDEVVQTALTGGTDVHAGRLRTASSPSRIVMGWAPYSCVGCFFPTATGGSLPLF